MNRISLLILVLFSALLANAETDSITDVSRNTRKFQLAEVIPEDGLSASPMFEVFQGLHPDKIREAYRQNRQESDSILASKQLEPVLWRSLLYQSGNIFRQKNKSPQTVLALLTPLLLVSIIGIGIAWIIRLFILPSGISPAERPETDMIEPSEETQGEESDHENE
jgi:hypothetical protein